MTEDGSHTSAVEIFCPANAVLNLLSGRWTLHIVRSMLEGKTRFNEIARANGLNPATLRERLRLLEVEGVVTRTVVSEMPPHVEYTLTDKGLALNGIFESVAQWGREWMRPKGAELVDTPGEDCPTVDAEVEECLAHISHSARDTTAPV